MAALASVLMANSAAHTGGQVSAEDAILSCEVLILKQEFLIDQPGDVRHQASPFVVCHEEYSS
jgi:hypothetical protein